MIVVFFLGFVYLLSTIYVYNGAKPKGAYFLRGLLVFLAVVPFLLIYLLYQMRQYDKHYSPEGKEGKRNWANIQKVKVGMDSVQAVSIMGAPLSVDTFASDKNKNIEYYWYFYLPPVGSSLSLRLVFDSTNHVHEVIIRGER